MGNEDYGDMFQSSHVEDDSMESHVAVDHGSFEPMSDAAPDRNAFSRHVSHTSKQPWYEPYLREIRRTR